MPYQRFFQLHSDDKEKALKNYQIFKKLAEECITQGSALQGDDQVQHKAYAYILGRTIETRVGDVRQRLTSLEVAEILESLEFTHHDPNQNYWKAKIYSDIAKNIESAQLYRPGKDGRDENCTAFGNLPDPYDIAAYLRFWTECWEKSREKKSISQIVSSEDTVAKWVPVKPPEFNVVLGWPSKGGKKMEISGVEISRSKRKITKHGDTSSAWGTQGRLKPEELVKIWDRWIDDGRFRVKTEEMTGREPDKDTPGLLFFQFNNGDTPNSEPEEPFKPHWIEDSKGGPSWNSKRKKKGN